MHSEVADASARSVYEVHLGRYESDDWCSCMPAGGDLLSPVALVGFVARPGLSEGILLVGLAVAEECCDDY